MAWPLCGNRWLVGWGNDLKYKLFRSSGKTYENLLIVADGTPLIVTQVDGSDVHRVYRTLDGRTVEPSTEEQLYGRHLSAFPKARGVVNFPVKWKQRIGSTSDLGNPPTYWFLVRDDLQEGHAYFVGYDSISKLPIGYISRQGFLAALPAREDWFDLGRNFPGRGNRIFANNASMSDPGYFPWRHRRADLNNVPSDWIAFLIDGKQILRLDLRERTVRMLDNSGIPTAVAMVREPVPPATKNVEEKPDEEQEGRASPQSLFRQTAFQTFSYVVPAAGAYKSDTRPKTVTRLIARHVDRVDVWDPVEETKLSYPLPERLHDQGLSAYSLGNGQLLVQVHRGYWERGNVNELIWLDQTGAELRQETVQLISELPKSPRERAWDTALDSPLPAAWAYRELIREPFNLLQWHQEKTYQGAILRTLRESWPALLTVLLLSVALTWLATRWHRKYCRAHAGSWVAFVFLLGLPGLAAYWLHHRRPVMETCKECGRSAPRDRDGCAYCQQPFAEPSLRGSEIFA